MNKATFKKIGVWIVFVVLGLFFVQAGLMKFTVAGWAKRLAFWGYPAYFHYAIGVVEMLSGVGLIVPRIRAYAAATLTLVWVHLLRTLFIGSHTI
ncbi:MAG: DoxX family protein [bacterium]